LALDDPADPFPDAYMRWCSSIEELRRLQAEVENLTRLDAASPAELPLPPDVEAMDKSSGSVAGPSPRAPSRNLPREEVDESFQNAVRRAPRR